MLFRSELQANAVAVLCLLLGGVLTAPLSAWLIHHINPIILGGFVGTALISLNIPQSWPYAVVAGVILTWRGVRRSRKAHVVVSTEVPCDESDDVPATGASTSTQTRAMLGAVNGISSGVK